MTNMVLHPNSQALIQMHRDRSAPVLGDSVDFKDLLGLVLELEAVVAKLTFLNNSSAVHLEVEAEVGLLVLERAYEGTTLKQVLG